MDPDRRATRYPSELELVFVAGAGRRRRESCLPPVAVDGDDDQEFTLANGGVVPMVVRVDAPPAVEPSVTVTRLDGGERLDATATLAAPSTPGRYRWETTYRWYPALLPQSVTGPLYRHHPWLPLIVTDLVLGGVAYLVSRRLLGSSRVHLYGNRGVLGRRRSRR